MRKTIIVLIAIAVPAIIGPRSTMAATINVPTDYLTIQAAIIAAQSGDTVQVAAGTYNENITLKSGVIVQGAGAATTTIQGTGTGSVVMAINVDSSAKIDGFTITGGSGYFGYGGGIYLNDSSPTISNNTITANSATWGGGIACHNPSSSSTISNNTITANSAYAGGGIFLGSSSPTISNNTITGNSAYFGGGISCLVSSSPTITNNTITGNSATDGGGISCRLSSNPTISNNTITGNTGTWGGGIAIYQSSPTISNNTITGNSSDYGGGIVCYSYSSPTITNNTIAANSAIYYGGGIYSFDSSSPPITNNTITGNSATDGGGIHLHTSSPPIINNTIAGNSATVGGGIYCRVSSSPTITNSIIWGNGDDLYDCSATYSDIEDTDAGTGNISADPKFVDPANGNYHLQPGSPCIDAGINAAVPYWLTTDFEGDPRIVNGTVDMGADEVSGTTPGETPVGENVSVTPVDLANGNPETSIEVTFSIVSHSGITSVTSSESGPPPPSGFSLGDPPTYFDISTTADVAPPITVCINYSGISFSDENMLRLFHQPEGGVLEDVTTSLDTANDIICGVVSSLSPFTVLEATYQFVGFFDPVQTGPDVVNLVKAGSAVPVKWQLKDESGGFIDDLSVVTGIHLSERECEDSSLLNDLGEPATSGNSGLRYDFTSNQFIYNWKSEKNMSGKCYRLNVKLFGFGVHSADFQMW